MYTGCLFPGSRESALILQECGLMGYVLARGKLRKHVLQQRPVIYGSPAKHGPFSDCQWHAERIETLYNVYDSV